MSDDPTLPLIEYRGPHTGQWHLMREFRIEVPSAGVTAIVPAGYDEYNGASIPPILYSLIGRNLDPGYVRPSLVHDYLYGAPAARDEPHWQGKVSTRRAIDDLFYEMLRQDGVSSVMAWTMWLGVRAGADTFFTEAEPAPTPVDRTPAERRANANMSVVSGFESLKAADRTEGIAAAAARAEGDSLLAEAWAFNEARKADPGGLDEALSFVCEVPWDVLAALHS